MTATLTRLAFRVEAKPFADAVKWATQALSPRPNIPVLGGVLLEVADGILHLSAFDHETHARATVDVPGASDGRVLVSGRLLAKLADTFKKPLDVSCDGAAVRIRCGTTDVELPTLPVEDYPSLPDMPPAVATVDAARFAHAVKRVGYTVSNDTALANLHGLRIRLSDGTAELATSDRYRAAVATLPCRTHDAVDIEVLPHAAHMVHAAPVYAALGGDITLHASNVMFGLSGGGRSIATRLIEHEFPKVESLFPARAVQPTTVVVEPLVEVVKRAELLKDAKGPILLAFDGETLAVRATGDDGKVSDTVDCSHPGAPITVALNAGFLLEAISACGGGAVELSMTEPKKPILFTAPPTEFDGDGQPVVDFRLLVVPIRI